MLNKLKTPNLFGYLKQLWRLTLTLTTPWFLSSHLFNNTAQRLVLAHSPRKRALLRWTTAVQRDRVHVVRVILRFSLYKRHLRALWLKWCFYVFPTQLQGATPRPWSTESRRDQTVFNAALAPPTLSEQSNIRLFRETWVTFVAVGGFKYDFWFVVKLRDSILVHGWN